MIASWGSRPSWERVTAKRVAPNKQNSSDATAAAMLSGANPR